ncbi:MAG: FtsP/CotA-like multicopper oxidase with cupredoxin domain [Planctomycetota bacterium]
MVDGFNCLQQLGDRCTDDIVELTPFIQPLPILPRAVPVPELDPAPVPANHQLWDEHPPVDLYDVHIVQAEHQFHPDLPPSIVWGFNGHPLGETYYANYGEPFLVRFNNDLPIDGDGTGFGKPETTIHLHNAHTASESDGNPGDFYPTGMYRDNHYGMFYAGGDENEALGTLWYHDHRADFTAQSVYKGLAGMALFFDHRDSGDEAHTHDGAFKLPSGEYDVPMILADKTFASTADHALYMDIFNTDGFLGDHYTVNGAVQPYFEVAARKYRLRFLDIGPSRFYRLAVYIEDEDATYQIPVTFLANDGNLLENPVEVDHARITPAERVDLIVDFSDVPLGDVAYLVNLEDQITGKGPTGTILDPGEAPKLLKFIVDRNAADPSEIPEETRVRPEIDEADIVAERTFVFDNINGIWTINGLAFDFNRTDVTVQGGTAERWTLENASGAWSHPVHIHLEEHHVITRNGEAPAVHEAGRKDVSVLDPGDTLVIELQFRDFTGKYPIHCHNTVHEDHAMMARWDVVD